GGGRYHADEPRLATCMTLPRHTKSSPIQLATQSSGRRRSRSIQAGTERYESCHPAALASATSAPYHAAMKLKAVAATDQSAAADARHKANGRSAPVKSSGMKKTLKVSRRSRAQRS